MINMSNRLERIAKGVPEGSRLADIGSDHAHLPVYLAQRGIIRGAVAGELNAGPYAAAVKQVREAGLSGTIDVRRGDGLEVLEPGETDVIAIAGMGGSLIVSILSAGSGKLAGVKKLILQPNVGEEQVRRFLLERDWYLERESILKEDGKIYEILEAVKDPYATEKNRLLYAARTIRGLEASADRLIAMGPYLLEEGSPVFAAKWRSERKKLERILAQLAQSSTEESAERRHSVSREIVDIGEVLACLPTDRRSFN